ncbi:MAG TPA: hypothetical protein VLH13_03910 [Methanomassiliicoccales archaeon]|nr:hypothetical protein [Methanomassiliicoccales archaeon]
MAPILLISLGGMLLFFSSFFGLIGFIAEPGFLIVALIVALISVAMVIIGIRIHRQHAREKKAHVEQAVKNARCEYCGTQNQRGDNRCDSCGAPLKN